MSLSCLRTIAHCAICCPSSKLGIALLRILKQARHFLVGDVDAQHHGHLRFASTLLLSVAVFPVGCVYSLIRFLSRQPLVIGIARNGHANASHFFHDVEPFVRRHLSGEFEPARVLLVVDQRPLSPMLWREAMGGKQSLIPAFPRMYRCMPGNRFVKRLYLSVTTRTSDTRRAFGLPGLQPPSRGGRVPQSSLGGHIGDLGRDSFVLMQIQRPEMFLALQELADRRIYSDRSQLRHLRFPILETYSEVQKLLGSRGLNVVDLWKAVGNPGRLISGKYNREVQSLDELHAWLYANCEVFLSVASGAWWIAWALGRPTLATDMYLMPMDLPITMFLPKLLWMRDQKRVMRLSEYRGDNIDTIVASNPSNFEVVPNSAEEIAEAVVELRSICRGDCRVDEDLQSEVVRSAQALLQLNKRPKPMPILGQGFIRRHPEILG